MRRSRPETTVQIAQSPIEIRLLGPEDSSELARLAQLDTAPVPQLPLLGGLVDGLLVAAHSLATGESIADPFRRTAEVRSLLAQRALHLDGVHPNGSGPR